jgi:hypothetical protein
LISEAAFFFLEIRVSFLIADVPGNLHVYEPVEPCLRKRGGIILVEQMSWLKRRTTNEEDIASHFLSRPSPQIIFKDPLRSDLNIRNDRKETRETKPYVGTF